MKKFKMLSLILLIVSCVAFSACIFSPLPKEKMTISGSVYINSSPLEGVIIKTSTKKLFTTTSNGTFTVDENVGELTIYPEKEGFLFSPKSYTVTQSTENIIFNAEEIKPLNGTLSLSKISITPSSIVSIADNFSYIKNGVTCLKVKNLFVAINKTTYNCLNESLYAVKNKQTTIDFDYDLSINTGIDFSIEFSLDAYFTSYRDEYVYEETEKSILNISKKQDTSMLDKNNQISYTFIGVNATNNRFSYNITFVFDYFPNI